MRVTITTGMLLRMQKLWEQGFTIDKIAKKMGLSWNTVASLTHREREMFPRRNRTAEWWRKKLKETEGLTAAQAAARLGVSKSSVYNWRRKLEAE